MANDFVLLLLDRPSYFRGYFIELSMNVIELCISDTSAEVIKTIVIKLLNIWENIRCNTDKIYFQKCQNISKFIYTIKLYSKGHFLLSDMKIQAETY